MTFNCGGGAVVITVTATRTISSDTTIDGGGLITLDGGGNSFAVFNPPVSSTVSFTVQNLTIANSGIAILAGGSTGATLTATNCTFSGNGMAISNTSGTVTVTNSTFSGNSAPQGGGAINNAGGTVTVTNSTFSGNTAVTGGGAIAERAGTLTVTNSTFSANSSGTFGGGIWNILAGTVTITNSTFSGNSTASGGGGAINSATGTVTVTNTIITNSPSGGNCVGTIIDGGNNLQFGDATCGATIPVADPRLDPAGLQSNGGPTQTLALCIASSTPSGCSGASPAINAGNQTVCAMTMGTARVNGLDQRGYVRPGMGAMNCAIGAFEPNSMPPPTATPTETPTGTPTDTPTATATDTATATATNTSTHTPTATATNTPTQTPTSTPTSTATPTATPRGVVITGGAVAGSTTVSGRSDPGCPSLMPNNAISIFSCGPEVPPVCHDGNDPLLATGTKDAMGNFVIAISPPLRAGEIIYATDGCFDPALVGPATRVTAPSGAPALSWWGMIGAAALMGGVALRALRRRR